MSTDDIQEVAKLVKEAKIALLTTTTASGKLVSRPLAVQKEEFDGDLWFFTQDPSQKTEEIAAHSQVNASFESGKGYLSVSGTASVVHDRAKIDEYWSKPVEAWFPDGKEDPTIALIRVEADTAEYWATDEPKAVMMFKIAKAVVTGDQPDIGTNRTVGL